MTDDNLRARLAHVEDRLDSIEAVETATDGNGREWSVPQLVEMGLSRRQALVAVGSLAIYGGSIWTAIKHATGKAQAATDQVGTLSQRADIYGDTVNFGPYENGASAAYPSQGQITAIGPQTSGVEYFDATGDFGQAMNNAWAALSDGGRIFPPAGAHTGSTSIVPQNSGVKIDAYGGEHNPDGTTQDLIGTRYDYTGTGYAWDQSQMSAGMQEVRVRGLNLYDSGTQDASGGFNLQGSNDMQNGSFKRCYAREFDGFGWNIADLYHYDLDDLWAFNCAGDGFDATSNTKIAVDGKLVAWSCGGAGIRLAGYQNGDISAYANGCGDGVLVSNTRGCDLTLGAEGNDKNGVHLFGGDGNDITVFSLRNDQNNGSNYELLVSGSATKATVGGSVLPNNHPEGIRLTAETHSIDWRHITTAGVSATHSYGGGLDHTGLHHLPGGNPNAGSATDGDSDGQVSISWPVAFSERPSLDVSDPSKVAGVTYTQDANNNYDGATVDLSTSGATIHWAVEKR